MEDGWIKLHRKMLDNPIVCKDADYLAVWIYLLLKATHTERDVEFNGKRIKLKKGQLIVGRKIIASTLLVSESKVTRILNRLEIEQQIEQQTCSKNRLISIVNWVSYQESEQQSEQQLNNKRTTTEQQLNNKRTTTEQQLNTNKNVKNDNNDKNDKKVKNERETLCGVLDAYTDDVELRDRLNEFKDYRTKIKKPLTLTGIKRLLSTLDKLSAGDTPTKIAIVEQTLEKGWQGFFELKSNNTYTSNNTPSDDRVEYYKKILEGME